MRGAAALLVLLAACHRGGGDPRADRPSSCVIEHDGGVTQCFEDVGDTAKANGAKYCAEMHGHHRFRVGKPCPKAGILGSCTKRAGTDLERVERCYRDEPACRARCEKSEGVFRN
jgi:hypothetical protein